jgi:hypothetical protein
MSARLLVLAVSLVAIPLVGALAQNNPTGNLGSNKSVTASPGTADNKAASGIDTGDVNAKHTRPKRVARNSSTPGGTGKTVVHGDKSTVKGDTAGTAEQKTGALSK